MLVSAWSEIMNKAKSYKCGIFVNIRLNHCLNRILTFVRCVRDHKTRVHSNLANPTLNSKTTNSLQTSNLKKEISNCLQWGGGEIE